MRFPLSLAAAGLFMWGILSTPAMAQTISAANPAGIVDTLQDLGYRATLETDNTGDPKIGSSVEGSNYTIFFYGCTQNSNCQYIQFVLGLDLANGTTMSTVNDWNENQLFGTVYVDDENDPFLKYLLTTVGGISRENFEDVIDWWRIAVSKFKNHVDF